MPSNTLGRLSSLRVLSLHSNSLSGHLPLADIANLTLLRSLYLHSNGFSGPLPGDALLALHRLSHLDLSSNYLSGDVPDALATLPKLTSLFLNNNSFSGTLPSFSLLKFNVSFNQLSGPIPPALARFNASSFAGNVGLCGVPLPPCSRQLKNRRWTIVAVTLLLFLLALLVLTCVLIKRKQRRNDKEKKKNEMVKDIGVVVEGMLQEETSSSGGIVNNLNFVRKVPEFSFDLEDLLRASAEVLGKGSSGIAYKAVLEDGTTVAVKRLKDVSASKQQFHHRMEALGKVDHPNLLPIRAYYFSKHEKLIVLDYWDGASLSSALHGSRNSNRTPLDWDSRMRIAIAAARGLSHLHSACKVVHGNIKASNVLLHSDPDDSVLSDFGLHLLFNSPRSCLVAPEAVKTRRSSFKSDVYSFGVLLLELLTGKAPNETSFGQDITHLPKWVQSIRQEEWTEQVFDYELMRYQNIENEMVQLLQIALACVARLPDSRPDISQVVRMMGEIGNRDQGTTEDY